MERAPENGRPVKKPGAYMQAIDRALLHAICLNAQHYTHYQLCNERRCLPLVDDRKGGPIEAGH
jgi:hypothetical protein